MILNFYVLEKGLFLNALIMQQTIDYLYFSLLLNQYDKVIWNSIPIKP